MSNNNEKAVASTTMNDDGDNNSSGGEQQPPNNNPPIITRFRSATDYEDESSLRDALRTDPPIIPNNNSMARLIGPCIMDGNLSSICCDYHPHSMEDEMKRLMELKEYAILDSEQEEKFERITALASRIFNVPICLVSLVDIGRQWFMSNR